MTLPSSIRTIGSIAFARNNLTDLVITGNVQTIGYSAFSNNLLTNVDFSNATSLSEIGSIAFANNLISSVELTNVPNLTKLGAAVFGSQSDSQGNPIVVEIDIPLSSSDWTAKFEPGDLAAEWADDATVKYLGEY